MNPHRRTALRATLGLGAAASTALAQACTSPRATGPEPLANSPEERRVLEVLADVDRNQRYLSVPVEDGQLLRVLVESMGAKHVVEVGTSTGYSGLWMLLGLMKTGGRLTTHEINTERHERARANFERAGLAQQATLVLGDAHVEVTRLSGPVDFVFLDADKDGYLDYLTKLRPLLRPGGLIAAHNMVWPSPDSAYLKAVTADPGLETAFVNMRAAGIGITLKKR
jgi:predicted O-methyltransferase YrrM